MTSDPKKTKGYRVLLAEDDASMRSVMRFNLMEESFVVTEVERGDDAVRLLSGTAAPAFDLVIADLKMPGADGMAVMEAARVHDPHVPVILVTAFGSLDQVSEAMRKGAADYITKPFQRAEFKSRVMTVMERAARQAEKDGGLAVADQGSDPGFVTVSPAMLEILRRVERIAPSHATVLVLGESGTGKELIARMVHARSDRASGAFVPVSCAAMPHDLLENELFGHERGAFTGADRVHAGKVERAHRGTLFLDEVGELPMDLQAKLLRVLEEGVVDRLGSSRGIEVDVRVVAATNRDLHAAVDDGTFRPDLYHRLSVIPIELPPLRDRTEDIPALVRRFLEDIHLGGKVTVAPALLAELQRQPRPGNVRQLRNAVSRMALLRQSDVLDLADLAPLAEKPSPVGPAPPPQAGLQDSGAAMGQSPLVPGSVKLPDAPFNLLDLEREIVLKALEKHDGNRSAAARYLGIPRHVLLYRLEKYGIGGKGDLDTPGPRE
ncbi:MAG: sigma-54 dependent transcriptional regulator [Acidobacteriota bacterium]